jgi:LCP family protein required for cell wall assembly
MATSPSRPYKHMPAAPFNRRRPASRVSPPSLAPAPGEPNDAALEPQHSALSTHHSSLVTRHSPSVVFRLLRWALSLLALIIVGYLGWVGYSLYRFEQVVYKPLPTTTPVAAQAETKPTVEGAHPFNGGLSVTAPTPTSDPLAALPKGRLNILVLGTDKRPNDTEHFPRSDTMILLNLDTEKKQVRVMSMPRDLIVEIPDYGESKLNSAYLYGEYYGLPGGGQALAVQTVSQLFNVPIDYYVAVNFDGFRKVIDTVGGIEVDVPYELDDYHYPSDDEGDPFGELHVHFDEGLQEMDGKTALRYARTRHADNDFMRNRRQLQVILATRKAALTLNLIPTLPRLIDDLAGTVETNIPFKQQLALAQLGYEIDSSDIITSTIDRDMILPAFLPDGSEGLELDWKAAQPVIESFFGRPVARERLTAKKSARARTPTPTVKRAIRTATRTPRLAPRATRTPTPQPTAEPTTEPSPSETPTPTAELPLQGEIDPVPTEPPYVDEYSRP